MTHALGCYYAPEHSRQSDRDYIAALQPPVIRLLDPDVQQIADMHVLVPNAIIAPRTWIIDDNSGAAVRNLMADPIGTGRDHANQYRGQLDNWREQARARELKLPADDRIYFNAANEPNQGGTPDKIAAYNVAFLDRCTELNIRAAALCLGVGWPDNTGPDTPVDWTPYASLPAAIKRGNHWLDLHEYHYKTGPQDGWRWLAGRHLQCPFDVPILLGEIGVDNYVDKPRWDKEGGNRGWQGNVSPDVYAEMIEYHITHSDRRVVAGLIFITDYRNNEWQNFDTNAAHNALLSRKDRMVPQAAPPIVSPGPQPVPPPTGTSTFFVNAPAGLRMRSRPPDGDTVTIVPFGKAVEVYSYQAIPGDVLDGRWARARYEGFNGWMRSDLLSAEPPVKPEPQPVPQPEPVMGDNWARSLAFVLQHEGGWADDPNDPGGATMKGITIGTYTRWREAHGQPAPTKDDLRNISDGEVGRIYFEWYWLPSSANTLPWPMCLAVMDLAVNGGIGRAQEAFAAVGHNNFLAYNAWRLEWYTRISGWKHFGAAWTRRVADLLKEGSE